MEAIVGRRGKERHLQSVRASERILRMLSMGKLRDLYSRSRGQLRSEMHFITSLVLCVRTQEKFVSNGMREHAPLHIIPSLISLRKSVPKCLSIHPQLPTALYYPPPLTPYHLPSPTFNAVLLWLTSLIE